MKPGFYWIKSILTGNCTIVEVIESRGTLEVIVPRHVYSESLEELQKVCQFIGPIVPPDEGEAVDEESKPDTVEGLWQKALGAGFKHWCSPDAQGVIGTKAQAQSFIADLIGVEVEIKSNDEHGK